MMKQVALMQLQIAPLQKMTTTIGAHPKRSPSLKEAQQTYVTAPTVAAQLT